MASKGMLDYQILALNVHSFKSNVMVSNNRAISSGSRCLYNMK